MPVFTLARAVEVEIDVRKSRFIGAVTPVAERAAAMLEVQRLRALHPNATHVCWALLAGGQSGMSDDGEPSGTAGRPMLEVLRHHDLDGVLATVVRYFGGIKLGAGGLMRAYTDAIAGALKNAERIERILMAELHVAVDYADEARVRRWLTKASYTLIGCEHGALAQMQISLPAAQIDAARSELVSITQGRAQFMSIEAPYPPR